MSNIVVGTFNGSCTVAVDPQKRECTLCKAIVLASTRCEIGITMLYSEEHACLLLFGLA